MSENNKSYRIRTEINSESPFCLNINLNQDYKNFEILSLNLDSESLYKMFTSEYGCVVGRVLANDALGIPNAKVSIFIPTKESKDIDPILYSLYPYETTLDKNDENIRYNTLPDEIVNECHQAVGTFPNKRLVLDDNNVLEIFDKYYKYSTVTNNSGDYMIYGVPVGEQTVHVDIDLSDIGELSQRPIDMMYKGYDRTQFESPSMFSKSTDLDKLTQIFSQNHQVYVNPFWGDDESQQVSITRCDISIQYKFEPTCIFIGSIVTDSKYAGFSKKCVPSPDMGTMESLIGTSGTIEIIRKTQGNNVESLVIEGTQLIDGSGRWCFQIPMNLDFVGTDEYGNKIATNDPNKGVPTRTRVRFRISSAAEHDEYSDLHITKVLVPHNPKSIKDIDYAFGDKTKDNEEATLSFRDLFKDNVYTVKSYIPRIQKGNGQKTTKFSGIKNVTDANGNNEIPYNNMRVNITFMFVLQCAILKLLIAFIKFINILFSSSFWYSLWSIIYLFVEVPAETCKKYLTCVTLGDAICPDMEGWYYAPGCEGDVKRSLRKFRFLNWLFDGYGDTIPENEKQELTPLKRAFNNYKSNEDSVNDVDYFSIDFGNDEGGYVCMSNVTEYLIQCVEVHLAMEHNVIQFDFYNDWLNGTIYIPKWFGTVKKKRSYLFGLIKRPEKIQACMEESFNKTRNLTQQCALSYRNTDQNGSPYNYIDTPLGCKDNDKQKCHKRQGRKYIKILGKNGGVVHKEETSRLDNVYYLRPMEYYEERIIFLFATDIVLLGSINQNNNYGIPYVFSGLQPSTYKFPTLLAMTNLQEESTQYTVCDSDKDDTKGVKPTYAQDEDSNDGPEYMYTEFAGVDWGFVGPGQGGQGVNSLTDLYFPGGHFLGISCFNSETNIKSCVNLSRACELGTSLSQFTEIPYELKNDSGDELKYKQYNANGLISRREITDSMYRNIFSTLNFNELKTISNDETLQREYQFLSNFSYNFDGSLQNRVNNDEYKKLRNLELITPGVNGDPGEGVAYGTAFEDYDIDYYRFRFGTYRGVFSECFAGVEKNTNGTRVNFIPVYNNSFYFYFGIKYNETAFDKLYEDYYSVCTNSTSTIPNVEVSEVTNNDFCEIHEGTAMLSISQLSSVYKIYFEYRRSSENPYLPYNLHEFVIEDNVATMSPRYVNEHNLDEQCEPNYVSNTTGIRGSGTTVNGNYLVSIYKKILFKDLLNGDYIVYVQMLNDSYEYKAHFSITRKPVREDPSIKEMLDSVTINNFKNGVSDPFERNSENTNKRGYISMTPPMGEVKGINILDISGNTVCSSMSSSYSGYYEYDQEKGLWNFYVPSGDTKYYIQMKYNCPNDYPCKDGVFLQSPYGYTVAYPELPLDYYFTDVRMEGRILRKLLTNGIGISKLNGNGDWYIDERLKDIATNANGDPNNTIEYAPSRLAWLEYALVYDEPLFYAINSHFPKTQEESASTETIIDNINVGFSTIAGDPKYALYGDEVSFSAGTDESKLITITPKLKKGEGLGDDIVLSEMPVYLPSVNIYADDNGILKTDHYFNIYIEKINSLGVDTLFKSDSILPTLHDYELEFIEEEEIEISEE